MGTVSSATEPVPFVKSIFHPSDFSNASESAFVHALAIALILKTQLIIMHARRSEQEDWLKFPAVRKTLARWQVLDRGSNPFEVFQRLGIAVTKVSTRGDPVRAIIRQIDKQNPDLIVLATRGRHGLPLWLRPSIAQAVARRTKVMTLFVPHGCRGVVSSDGDIRLRRILLPIDHKPNAQEAVTRAVRAAEALGDETVEVVILHVNGGDLPRFDRPPSAACTWKEMRGEGDVAAAILSVAQQDVHLIIMATEGRQGIVDAMRGSVTERVVRGAPCPVLAVPAR
jgi:nucleotide-binding universal stress UspA family protein